MRTALLLPLLLHVIPSLTLSFPPPSIKKDPRFRESLLKAMPERGPA